MRDEELHPSSPIPHPWFAMPQRLRTFVAVPLDRFTHDRLVGLQKRLADAGVPVKWVEPDNLHITLLFLGEVDAREVPAVCTAVLRVNLR